MKKKRFEKWQVKAANNQFFVFFSIQNDQNNKYTRGSNPTSNSNIREKTCENSICKRNFRRQLVS